MKTSTRKLLFAAVMVLILAAALITGCTPPTAEVIEVEKVVTQVITEKVVETVVVEGTAQIVEREVETIVEVTATPDQSVTGVMKAVPRNRTLVLGAWEQSAQLIGSDNFNPIINVASLRTNYAKWVYEALMYYNMNTGEEYPWLAEGYELDEDFMGITMYLRKGVEWSDGEPFNCDDVKFTIEAHRDTETAARRGEFLKWIESVECIDDFTVRVNYTDVNPRLHQRMLIGWENHFVIVPEHIFAGKDVATFTNLDLGKGLPVGTGPYKLVLVSPQQVIYDRRDDWWGTKIGFMDAPAPERIVGTTAASIEAYAQMYMIDKIDYGGFALLVGDFEAAKEKNPNVRSWFPEGPKYGAPDGCVYNWQLNNAKFRDVNVRLAINYALDRQEIVDLGVQGATHPAVTPISSYVMGAWGDILQPILDKYNRDAPSQDKVEEYMAEAGYEMNTDGYWEKDGEVLEISVNVHPVWNFLSPVVTEQLIRAGFKAEEYVDNAGQVPQQLNLGEADGLIWVRCGSNFDPFDTFYGYRSECNSPVGETGPCTGFDAHRYAGDPELDAVLVEMEKTAPDPNNPQYVEWVETAMDIWLRDMPSMVLAEELHVITMNETYWTGYPTSENPYIAPYPCWNDFTLAIFNVQPTQ